MHKILFVDRDGVINVDPIGDYIKCWEDFRFEKGALKALKSISDSGYEIIVISNQAGIGDGIYPESALWDIHEKMMLEFKNNGINVVGAHYCLHGKNAGCSCRKPQTGLFEQAAKNFDFNPAETYFIGDKATDIDAGKRFGLKTIFVLTGHGTLDQPKLTNGLKPDYLVKDLSGAAEVLKP